MPTETRAARWAGVGALDVVAVDRADPGPDEVLIVVESTGICGSDLHVFRGEFDPTIGVTPGHEFAGRVAAAGSAVTTISEGDLVGVEPLLRCGLCSFCASGDYHVCDDRALIGGRQNGGLTRHAIVPAMTAFRVPAGLDAEVAAIAEPLACSVHGYDKVKLRGHETVFIVGAGTIGLTAALAAKANGAAVVVLARHPHQQEAARRMGADEVIGEDEAGQARMDELRRAKVVDVAVETVGGTGDTLLLAQMMVRPKGRVVVLGVFSADTATINPLHLAMQEVEIVGSMTYASNEGRADYAIALDVVADNADAARSLITHRFGLDQVNEAFETALDKSSRSIKVHVKPTVESID